VLFQCFVFVCQSLKQKTFDDVTGAQTPSTQKSKASEIKIVTAAEEPLLELEDEYNWSPHVDDALFLRNQSTATSLFQSLSVSSKQPNSKDAFQDVTFDPHLDSYLLPLPKFLSTPRITYNQTYLNTLELDIAYFQTPSAPLLSDDQLAPYDKRFFQTMLPPNRLKNEMKRAFKAWAAFADAHRIPCWIAHESLLGWYWGKRMLPWQNKITVQMEVSTLLLLISHLQLNESQPVAIAKDYVLDVNPHYVISEPLPHNPIDARLIHTSSGISVDIVALRVSYPHFSPLDFDPDTQIESKRGHRYRKGDMYPLVRTHFEGIGTWRAFQTAGILMEEFGDKSILKEKVSGKFIWNGTGYDGASLIKGRVGKWTLTM
jgi:hypothetical protein